MIPDELSVTALTRDLPTTLIARRVLYFPSLTSTMDAVRDEARRGAPEGTAVVTSMQTAGRGRLKRAWLSPAGSVAVSILLYPQPNHLPTLVMVSSLAVARAIATVTGLAPEIKWPNDVLVRGKKVCGILIDSDVQGERVTSNIGIGINVNVNMADYPDIQALATSLSQETGKAVSRLAVVRGLLVEMDRLYLTVRSGGSVWEEWRARLVTLGKSVRARSGDTVYEGIAEDVAHDGSLLVRSADGHLHTVVAGDVTLRD